MTGYARNERLALADVMRDVGPDAPTRCEGWTVRDLAAHLVLRERRLDAAPGIVVAPLRAYTAKVQRRLRERPWTSLLEMVRSGPPALLRPVDEQMNLAEMFVHHEDVRRAQPGWEPRELDAGEERALWARVSPMLRLSRRRLPAGIRLEAAGFGEADGGPPGPRVTVTGTPGELLLFVSGRQDVARVQLSGPADLVERLSSARLGI